MADMIQIRRDTAANWTSANPILAQGELGAETDTSKIKIGDGTTAWASLSYLIDAGGYLTAAAIGSTVQAYDATIVVDADIGSTVQAYDADTTKNDVANTFTAAQTFGAGVVEKKVAIAASEIDLALGNYFTKTISGSTTFTIANTAASGSVNSFVLELTNAGTNVIVSSGWL